jgi:hypothetical protein
MRLGSLDQLRWNAGNREGGRPDEGSVHGGSSASGSRHGGSAYSGSRHGSRHGGNAYTSDRSVHGASRLANGSVNGSVHGGGNLALQADGSSRGGAKFLSAAALDGSAEVGYGQKPPGFVLPGQGGPLQDNAGISESDLEAQTPRHGPLVHKAVVKPARGAGSLLMKLLRQWRGGLDTAHPRPAKWWGLLVMPFGAFLSILWIAGIDRATDPSIDMKILIPSFGASAVLLFAVPESKLSQPRNFVGGQFFSAVVGCVCRDIFPDSVNWVAAPVGVGVAVLVMQITRTVHPPGGATALLLASQVPHGRWASWIGVPAVMIGSLGMLVIALLMNLIAPGRRYPTFWWGADNFFGGL